MFVEAVMANALGGLIALAVVALYKWLSPPRLNRRQALVIFIVSFLVIALTDLTPMPVGETIRVAIFGPPSENERWTLEAWNAFERGDYLAAINSAEKVIDQYDKLARRHQAELEKQEEPLPPVGKVSPGDAEKIFSRWKRSKMSRKRRADG